MNKLQEILDRIKLLNKTKTNTSLIKPNQYKNINSSSIKIIKKN
jgi:hypothetical protein